MFHIAENIPWRQLWNYVIEKFDYQGWVGRQLKYLIYLNEQLIGCMAFADAVLQLSASDNWIIWNTQQRQAGVVRIIKHVQFLILPQVKIKIWLRNYSA